MQVTIVLRGMPYRTTRRLAWAATAKAPERSLELGPSVPPLPYRKEIREPLENRSDHQTFQLGGIELVLARETASVEARRDAIERRLLG